MRLRSFLLLLLALLLLPALAAPAPGQVGVTTDILTGRITGPTGEPLSNAAISATSLETGIRRSTLTNAQGRYTLIFPDGGGRYQLEITQLGMATHRLLVVRQPHDDVLVTDIRLDVAPIVIEGITVLGAVATPEPGTRERVFTGDELHLLPVDPADLAALADLEAGVVRLEADDSIGSGGFSIAGQRPDLNQVTLDGASFGSPRGDLGIPQEAVRVTRVISNSYDVARGQFSGGQISTTTRGGTNRVDGSVSYSLDEPRLQWHDERSPFSGAFTQHRISGGVGGPIRRDRTFYFGSAALQYRTQGLRSLTHADAAALQQLGAHPDSVERFLGILRGNGLSPTEPAAAPEQISAGLTMLGRLDFTLSDRHSLMVRGDAQVNRRAGTRVNSLSLPHSGGDSDATGGGAMLSLTSRFGERWVNELRAYASAEDSESAPYFPVPEGRVRVASVFEDDSRSVSTLVFGGSRALPISSMERTLEVSNELSWLGGGRHRVKLGALINATRSAQEHSPVQFGSFSFNSLEDFAQNRASSYTRSLTSDLRHGGGINTAVYLGDVWQATHGLQLTYGLRLEGSMFALNPQYNPAVDALFGRRTDRFPAEVHVSPRLGFTYSLPPLGRQSPGTIRGGLGVFRGRPPFSLYSTAMDATGLPDGQIQIVCVGDDTPIPDWELYREDPSLIPISCADGEVQRRTSGRAPNVTVFDRNFSAPRSVRASLGLDHRLGSNMRLSLDATYNQGVSLYGVSDLNLAAEPRFTVDEEGRRPVYVAPDQIVQSTGRLGMLDSRVHPEFGHVLEIHSDLRSESTQLSVGLRGTLLSKLSFRTSYTLSYSRDQSSFSCCSALQGFGRAPTAGDPNEAEWATSDFERRHSFTATAGLPVRPWMEVTLVGRLNAGTPFTPVVGGDINGDGVRNDRAFIFDPATAADSAVAVGMARLLETAPSRVQECLVRQLGQIAGRNSCQGPWSPSLELRSNMQPELPGFGRRVTISLASRNLLGGIDRILHGLDDLRGWGQRRSPDRTLLYPRGFDPEALSFRYEVNERFGDSRQERISFHSPFQLHLQARMAVGPQRRSRGGE